MVEILGGLTFSEGEFSESTYSSKIILDGAFALVIRYKRERDGKYRPACIIGYDRDETGAIRINQIQGSRDRSVAFRFYSSFRTSAFLLKLVEESFFKKGIPVYIWILFRAALKTPPMHQKQQVDMRFSNQHSRDFIKNIFEKKKEYRFLYSF